MIDELSRSIRAHLYERITNPFLGAVAIAWSVWNYKLILVLLSSEGALEKIRIIETRLYSEWYEVVLYFLICPLISGMAFLFAYPIPGKLVYRYTRKQLRDLKAIKLQVDDETPASQEEFVKLRRKVNEVENKYFTDLTEKDAEISRLQQILASRKTGSEADSRSQQKAPVASGAAKEIERKSEEHALVSSGQIKHRKIVGAKVGGSLYRLGEDIKSDEPGEVSVIRLKDSFEFEEKIPVSLEIDGPLEPNQVVWVFDGYSHRELKGLDFEIQKADFEKKNARIEIHQPNPLKPGNQVVVSNIIQFGY